MFFKCESISPELEDKKYVFYNIEKVVKILDFAYVEIFKSKQKEFQISTVEITEDEFKNILESSEMYILENKNIDYIRKEKIKHLNFVYRNILDNLYEIEVSEEEKTTWIIQEKEARLYKETKNELDCPFVCVLAKSRGVPLSILVDKIIEKSDLYRNFLASLTGKRQKLEDIILKSDFKAISKIDINLN